MTESMTESMTAEKTLAWLLSRRSRRSFTGQPIAPHILHTLVQAATSAPSASNRQPWRFAVVSSASLRHQIATAVYLRAEEMKALIARGHHAQDYASYGDFFHEPLQSAAVIVIPQYREYPDLIANLLLSGGADPGQFNTASSMHSELCSTSAAVMNLLLQAHASGLGACWMAGPMIAKDAIGQLLDITEPWRMVGAVALGYPADGPPARHKQKPLDRVVQWFD
jgi:nitroreductase